MILHLIKNVSEWYKLDTSNQRLLTSLRTQVSLKFGHCVFWTGPFLGSLICSLLCTESAGCVTGFGPKAAHTSSLYLHVCCLIKTFRSKLANLFLEKMEKIEMRLKITVK